MDTNSTAMRGTIERTDITDSPLAALVEQVLAARSPTDIVAATQRYADSHAPGSRLFWHTASETHSRAHHLARDPRSDSWLTVEPGAQAPQLPWPWIGRLIHHRLDQLRNTDKLFGTISGLARAERLQRALYTISDLADSEHDFMAMMQQLHQTVSTLMYAENFYVALYDEQSETVSFPYFVDAAHVDGPATGESRPLATLRHGLLWYLLHDNKVLMGNRSMLARQVDGPFQPQGPDCSDLLAVPMHNDGVAIGALVVHSYNSINRYTEQDRELLTYVAQQLQAELERRRARDRLENRVAERTAALHNANRALQQQVAQRQRGELLQSSLFRIAELSRTTRTVHAFCASVHQIIGKLMHARNFFVALRDEGEDRLTFPYSVDEIDKQREPRTGGRGITEYVLRQGTPLLARTEDLQALADAGEIVLSRAQPVSWLSVPLIWNDTAFGVLAIQSYSTQHVYQAHDQELLSFVGVHIANALQHMRDQSKVKQAYARLEERVAERTRELSLANHNLRRHMAERERIERRLEHESLHDSLTGLPNRALLQQRMQTALEAYQSDASRSFGILFIDLDRFKVINDSLGHMVGDELLYEVGERIRSLVKPDDTVARLGGDEFAVLLQSVASADTITRIANRIIEALHAPLRVGTRDLYTSASIGISMASTQYQQPDGLLRDADAAMYSAKSSGRHRAEMFDRTVHHEALQVMEIENDLRRGLPRGEFVPYYQPVIDMNDGALIGYEALMRWQHPERGTLEPSEFLQVAEDADCIQQIDWQIWEQVCADATTLEGPDRVISINLSARHFTSPELAPGLCALLDKHDVRPERMVLEITERTLLGNPEQTKRTLDTFRQHGMTIALDDFGTGYSSLNYMHQYPFEVLKIDQGFVAELDATPDNQSRKVIHAILTLAASLGIQVIAEGIETDLQQQILRDMGCRYGQGFLFAPAQPASHWNGPCAEHPAPPRMGGLADG